MYKCASWLWSGSYTYEMDSIRIRKHAGSEPSKIQEMTRRMVGWWLVVKCKLRGWRMQLAMTNRKIHPGETWEIMTTIWGCHQNCLEKARQSVRHLRMPGAWTKVWGLLCPTFLSKPRCLQVCLKTWFNPYANHGAGICTYKTGQFLGFPCRFAYSSTMEHMGNG